MSTVVTLPKALEEVETNLLLKAGTYLLELSKGEIKKGPNADFISYQVSVFDKERLLGTLMENISLSENSLWKLKKLLLALKLEAKGKKFDYTKTLGIKFLGDVIVTEFETRSGDMRKKNEIADFSPYIGKDSDNLSSEASKGSPKPPVKESVKEDDSFDDDAF